MQQFSAAVVVSAYQNRLLCPFPEYRAFLNYMTGEDLYIYDIPMARTLVAKHLERHHAALRRLPAMPEKTDSGAGNRHVKACVQILGRDSFGLRPMNLAESFTHTPEEYYRAVT